MHQMVTGIRPTSLTAGKREHHRRSAEATHARTVLDFVEAAVSNVPALAAESLDRKPAEEASLQHVQRVQPAAAPRTMRTPLHFLKALALITGFNVASKMDITIFGRSLVSLVPDGSTQSKVTCPVSERLSRFRGHRLNTPSTLSFGH